MSEPFTTDRIEWPTLGLMVLCYALWLAALWLLPTWLAIVLLGPVIALHSSLTHEVVHGHPFRWQALNAALVFPALTLTVPYARFRDTHLAHHHDPILTDPYDDPESNYLDPAVWAQLNPVMQALLRFNNRLFGRLTIGPVFGQILWMMSDFRQWREGDDTVFWGWVAHLPAVILVVWVVAWAPLPIWAYLLGTYLAHGLLRLRTYLEHRAHDLPRARTAIVEDRGLLALLFLNNNLHVVHHMHPKVAWYNLPKMYQQNRDHYLARNDHYVYRSYKEVLTRYFWRAKDPVPHPLWPWKKVDRGADDAGGDEAR